MARFDNGQKTQINPPGINAGHMSCRNYQRPGWCYTSENLGKNILAIKLDGSQTVERFTFSRSTETEYDAYAMAVPTPDGRKVMFRSNWGGGAIYDYVVNRPDDGTSTSLISTITVNSTSIEFGNVPVNAVSIEKIYNLNGSNLSSAVTVTSPSGFTISKTSGSGFAASLSITPSSGSVSQNIYVRFTPTTVKSYTGNITHVSSGATSINVVLSGIGVSATPAEKYYPVEAENGVISFPFIKGRDRNASGRKYIYVFAGAGNTTTPKVEAAYSISIMDAGNYYVWLRIYTPALSVYGTFVGFNGVLDANPVLSRSAGVYEWVKSGSVFALSAGTNKFTLGHGNEQTRIDKIIITNSSSSALPSSVTGKYAKVLTNMSVTANLNSSGKTDFVADLPESGDFNLKVLNASGQKIWHYNQTQADPGFYSVSWEKGIRQTNFKLQSGIYFTVLEQKGNQVIQKFMIVR
jgi:hypothetical protein